MEAVTAAPVPDPGMPPGGLPKAGGSAAHHKRTWRTTT